MRSTWPPMGLNNRQTQVELNKVVAIRNKSKRNGPHASASAVPGTHRCPRQPGRRKFWRG